jgi:hypothetical protein
VATIDTGIVTAMISVLRRSLRKRSRTPMAIRPPIQAFWITSSIEARMKRDWSAPTTTSTPSGSSFLTFSSRSWTALATATVLASPSL